MNEARIQACKIVRILEAMHRPCDASELAVTPFLSREDGEAYNVWRITQNGQTAVLKQAKEYEAEIYRTFLAESSTGAPRVEGIATLDGETYILMEYVEGHDLCKCTRADLVKTLDALIALQKTHWENTAHAECGYSFEKSLKQRVSRGNFLKDPALEAAYASFLAEYRTLPRTLCHDDLLPFNVIAGADRAVLIDWEYAGILPYPAPLARLIAHCEPHADAFFFMTDEDRAFAIDYYYAHFVAEKDIDYAEYRRSVDLFLLYEYCEWIMLGVKYADADQTRHAQYREKAKKHLAEMKSNQYQKGDLYE